MDSAQSCSRILRILLGGFAILALTGCDAVKSWVAQGPARGGVSLQLEQPSLTLSEGDLIDIGVSVSTIRTVDTLVTVTLSSSRLDVAADFSLLPQSTVTIPAGVSSTRVSMRVANDSLYEGQESFLLEIQSQDPAVSVSTGSYVLVVDDDNSPPDLTFDTLTDNFAESAGAVTIGVSLSAAAAVPTTLSYVVSGSSTRPSDHSLNSGSLSIAAGSTTASIVFNIVDDVLGESNETILISLSSPVNASLVAGQEIATRTIIDNDLALSIDQSLTQADPTNLLPLQFTAVFSQAADPATFDASDITQNGTATGITWAVSTSDNIVWLIEATAVTGDGTVVPSVIAGRVQSPDGYQNLASASADHSVLYDSTAPTVTIEKKSGQTTLAAAFPIEFTVTFSEAINATSLATTDFTQNGTATSVTWVLINSGDDKTFTLRATAGSDGSYEPVLAAGVVVDPTGNLNIASTSVDNYVVKGFTVAPVYAKNGKNWNDYVVDNGSDYHSATGAACVGTETDFKGCRHAGEIRRVIIPGATSCAGLTATDALGVFDWGDCDMALGVPALYTRKLKDGKGLRDLLKTDGTGWKSNSVTVAGSYTGTTNSEPWWKNTVSLLPSNGAPTDSMVSLSTASTIYVAIADIYSQGYNLTADKIGIATLNGARIFYGGKASDNCNNNTGTTTSPDLVVMFCGAGRKYIWLEADQKSSDGVVTQAERILLFADFRFFRWHNSSAGFYAGAELIRTESSRFTHLKLSGWASFTLVNAKGNYLADLTLSRMPLFLIAPERNIFTRIITTGGWIGGIHAEFANDNVFSQVIVAHGDSAGMTLGTSFRNVLVGMVAANNPTFGFGFWTGDDNVIHNAAVLNNEQGFGIYLGHSTVSQVIATNQTYDGIIAQGVNSRFSGVVKVGNNGSDCNVVATGGLTGVTCAAEGLSVGVTPVLAADMATSFRGRLSALGIADSVNGSDTLGAHIYPATIEPTFDWTNFENPFRNWARDGGNASNVHIDHRDVWWSGAGSIWDWTIRSTDTTILNRTGDGTNANAAFVNGAACPALLSGNDVINDISLGELAGDGVGDDDATCETGETCRGRTYLRNAFEILDDDIGNDNGLCESNESCLYTPNFGSYQGHGDYTTNECTFQNGTVTGARIYAYPSNGY